MSKTSQDRDFPKRGRMRILELAKPTMKGTPAACGPWLWGLWSGSTGLPRGLWSLKAVTELGCSMTVTVSSSEKVLTGKAHRQGVRESRSEPASCCPPSGAVGTALS